MPHLLRGPSFERSTCSTQPPLLASTGPRPSKGPAPLPELHLTEPPEWPLTMAAE